MSDVTQISRPRTYPLPASVVTEAKQGLEWLNAYKIDADTVLAPVLATGASLTIDMVAMLADWFDQVEPALTATGWKPGTEDYPSYERIEWALHGGSDARRWSNRILEADWRESDRAITASLEKIGHDTEEFTYCAIMDEADPSIIRRLVRLTAAGEKWDSWEKSGWEPIEDSQIRQWDLIELDDELTGFAAAAILDGADGVQLAFAEPVAFLSALPILAAGMPDEVASDFIYAIVDATDTTAVMDLIKLEPGPKAYVRKNGAWVEDSTVITQLTGIQPPPLVELTGEALKTVLEQIDMAGFPTQEDVDAEAEQADAKDAADAEKQAEKDAKAADKAPAEDAKPEPAKDAEAVSASANNALSENPGVVIVAVPSKDDPIWDVSSEDVPHITMIWLGKTNDLEQDPAALLAAVKEAAAELEPMTLKVSGRETLGDDAADVLMLDPDVLAWARDGLLEDSPEIKAAHDAAKQFPKWIPHLTMGYPEAPAQGEAPEEITFDTLGLWHAGTKHEIPMGRGLVAATKFDASKKLSAGQKKQIHDYVAGTGGSHGVSGRAFTESKVKRDTGGKFAKKAKASTTTSGTGKGKVKSDRQLAKERQAREDQIESNKRRAAAVDKARTEYENASLRHEKHMLLLEQAEMQRQARFEKEMDVLRNQFAANPFDPNNTRLLQEASEAERVARQAYKEKVQRRSLAWRIKAIEYRENIQAAALTATAGLRKDIAVHEMLDNLVLVSAGGLDRNRGGADNLRKYWVHGKGALKIRWGTSGDWTRCVMHLTKYLGPRAKGYCALRHKEATGLYTGDHRNTH